LFVGNLDFDTTEDDLRTLFGEAGDVVSITLPTDRDTGRPRGFAFVEMSTVEQAAAVLEKFNGVSVRGRAIRLDAASEKPARSMGPRPNNFGRGPGNSFAPGPRSRPKGSRRNLRARKRSL
jgi:nucleolin